MSHWYVVLIGTQQEVTTVWRLHVLGLELFTPVIRRRVKTGRVHRGRPLTRLVVRPMFPSYGFVRTEDAEVETLLGVNGVRDVLRNQRKEPVTLPDAAVQAIFDKQQEELLDFIENSRRRRRFASNLHLGQRVRVEDDGVYSGLMATVDRIDANGRIEVLFGMIRHSLPTDMVVVA